MNEEMKRLAKERDSYKRQLDAIGDALVTSIVKRIEPRLSRHPVTVIMAAGSLIAKIGEAIGCEFEDGDDLLEAVKELVRERDKARSEFDDVRSERDRTHEKLDDALNSLSDAIRQRDEARAEVEHAYREGGALFEAKIAEREAFRCGAEAMREACADAIGSDMTTGLLKTANIAQVQRIIANLPIPEEP